MFIIIGTDGKTYGPVDAETIKNWISRNLANAQTRARRAGDGDPVEWKTLGDFPEFAADLAAIPPPLTSAATPPQQETNPRTQETVPVNATEFADKLISENRSFSVSRCLGLGWAFIKTDYWPLLGVSFLIFLCQMAAGCIPYIGPIIQLAANGILLGGLYYYFLGKMRKEPRKIDDAFIGFSRVTKQLILGGAIPGLLGFVSMIPGIILTVVAGFLLYNSILLEGLNNTTQPSPEIARLLELIPQVPIAAAAVIFTLCILLMLLPCFYLGTVWQFTVPLVMDKRIGFWDAMTISRRVATKRFWRLLALGIVNALILSAGTLLCGVGFFLALPWAYAAYLHAYEDLFVEKNAV